MPFDFDTLPPLLHPKHDRCFMEAVGDARVVAVKDWVERRHAALCAAIDFAKEIGAVSVLDPRPYATPETPRHWAFNTKPEGKAWQFSRPRARDRYHMGSPGKGAEADELRSKMEALPPFPPLKEIIELADLVTSITYEFDGGGRGSSAVGFPGVSQGVAYVAGRYFVYFDNPFEEMKSALEHPGGKITRPEIGVEWRPGEGWELRSKAQVDLVFAQAAVEEEEAA